MLFRRRKPQGFWQKVKAFFWPSRSHLRSVQYISKRVLRLSATPHAIAAGVAAGVFASFTPYLGFHFFLAAAVAWALSGNLLASALGTAVGNPITFPFIWGGTLAVGRLIVEGRHPDQVVPLELGRTLMHLDFATLWKPLLLPMTVGSIPLGIAFGLLFYWITYGAVSTFQAQRRKRLADSARRRAESVAKAGLPAA